jgi:hypothetical protein
MASVAHNAACLRWNKRNPDKTKVYQKRHRSTEEFRQRRREKRKEPENRAKDLAQMKKQRLRNRDAVIAHYGGKCACCGESNKGFLTGDHINGQVPEMAIVGRKLNHSELYKYLVKNNFPPGYQLLCCNCNMATAWWGICPHKREPY